MEPRIQYAKTKDGVKIAFYVWGRGLPFVHMPAIPFSHVHLDWQLPQYRRFYAKQAESNRIVRYSARGTGLSDRQVDDLSIDAQLLDLEAVVDQVGLDRFALFGHIHTGPAAIVYATRHPERVSHLLLWCSYARASDIRSQRARALRALLNRDWELYTEAVAQFLLGYPEGEDARRFAALYREAVTPERRRTPTLMRCEALTSRRCCLK
jgi:pimeloyl-ACP methyl ester carboxylesterase